MDVEHTHRSFAGVLLAAAFSMLCTVALVAAARTGFLTPGKLVFLLACALVVMWMWYSVLLTTPYRSTLEGSMLTFHCVLCTRRVEATSVVRVAYVSPPDAVGWVKIRFGDRGVVRIPETKAAHEFVSKLWQANPTVLRN